MKEGDKIYPEIMKFNLQTEKPLKSIPERLDVFKLSTFTIDEYNKYLEVFDPQKIKPAYKDVNSSSTRLIICDFKNNCDVTRFYDFNSSNLFDKVKSYILQSKTISSGSQLDYKYLNEPYDYQCNFHLIGY